MGSSACPHSGNGWLGWEDATDLHEKQGGALSGLQRLGAGEVLLGFSSSLCENRAFPIWIGLHPSVKAPKSLLLFLPWSSLFYREGKLRHMWPAGWAGSAASLYLL